MATPIKNPSEHLKSILYHLTYQRGEYERYKEEAERLAIRLDIETKAKSPSFENDGSSKSFDSKMTTYLNELIITQATAEAKAKKAKRYIDFLEQIEMLHDRVDSLNDDEKEMFENVFISGENYRSLADDYFMSVPGIQKRVDTIIEKMLKIE